MFDTELECMWTDENGVPMDPNHYSSVNEDGKFVGVESAHIGALSALDIADGIGFAVDGDLYSLAQSNLTTRLNYFENNAAERNGSTPKSTSLEIPAFIL